MSLTKDILNIKEREVLSKEIWDKFQAKLKTLDIETLTDEQINALNNAQIYYSIEKTRDKIREKLREAVEELNLFVKNVHEKWSSIKQNNFKKLDNIQINGYNPLSKKIRQDFLKLCIIEDDFCKIEQKIKKAFSGVLEK